MFRPQRFAPRDSHVRSLRGLAYSAARSACSKPARRGERRANAHRWRKLSEFGARTGDNDDLAFNVRFHPLLLHLFMPIQATPDRMRGGIDSGTTGALGAGGCGLIAS